MSVLLLLAFLSLQIGSARGFCFFVTSKIDATQFLLSVGPHRLNAPFGLKHGATFETDEYNCQVMNEGATKSIPVVHCCYTGSGLIGEAEWGERDFETLLKRVYFS